jgi:hypothetical protein
MGEKVLPLDCELICAVPRMTGVVCVEPATADPRPGIT